MGVFSEQFATMVEAHQLKVTRVEFNLGEATDVNKVMGYVYKEDVDGFLEALAKLNSPYS